MWLTLIPLILSIVTQIPKLITEAEAAFSGKPGSGALKKAFVLDSVGAALGTYQSVAPHPLPADHVSAVLGTISSVTDAVVSGFNTAGIFKNGNPPVPDSVASEKAA